MSDPIRVLVVDDHQVVREGLRAMLRGVVELEIVGEAEDADHARSVIAAAHPDVVLLEYGCGLDACRVIVDGIPRSASCS